MPSHQTTLLSMLPAGVQGIIVNAFSTSAQDAQTERICNRLHELGFLPGETITLLRRGPGGNEPLAVQVGDTVFALRSIEAACIEIAIPLAA